MKQREGRLRITRRRLLSYIAGATAANPFPLALALSNIGGGAVASTVYGKVRGILSDNVLSFRGVPYGGAADGTNRFMPPTKPTPWKDTRDATKAGPRAMQVGAEAIFGSPLIGNYFSGGRKDALGITAEFNSENCLVLNVLTPALRGRRPVMVYIHGGGLDGLSGALTLISDRFVAEQDIVLVGVNRRLNVFGYTYLAGLDAAHGDSGNIGQLDLIAALKWIRENIENFGGDPSNVTLFGESGGGGKISTLLAMPDAKFLFHRAIIESGSYLLKVREPDTATEDTRKLLSRLGLNASQIAELWRIPADKLLSAYRSTAGHGGPVVDGRSLPHQTWAPGAPPEAAGVSLIIGSDRGFRRNAVAQAEAKLQQGNGDVYMYYFAWDTRLGDGRLRAFHTAELPLAMRLVADPKAEELSKEIAGAWAAFARRGDPNHAGLPPWEKYSLEQRSTMIFDAGKTAPLRKPAGQELALLAPFAEVIPN